MELQPWQPGSEGNAIVFGGIDNPGVAIWATHNGSPHHYEVASEAGIGNFLACTISPDGGVSVNFGDPSAAQDVVNKDPRLHVAPGNGEAWQFTGAANLYPRGTAPIGQNGTYSGRMLIGNNLGEVHTWATDYDALDEMAERRGVDADELEYHHDPMANHLIGQGLDWARQAAPAYVDRSGRVEFFGPMTPAEFQAKARMVKEHNPDLTPVEPIYDEERYNFSAIKRHKKTCPDCHHNVKRHFNHHRGFGYSCNYCGWWGSTPNTTAVDVPDSPPVNDGGVQISNDTSALAKVAGIHDDPELDGASSFREFEPVSGLHPDHPQLWEYHSYEPGQPGKGFILPDGRVATWNVSGYGAPGDDFFGGAGPHHAEVAQHLGLDYYGEPSEAAKEYDRQTARDNGYEYEEEKPGWHSPISIDSAGNYKFLNWNDNFRKEHSPAFRAAGLTPAEENGEWHFGSQKVAIVTSLDEEIEPPETHKELKFVEQGGKRYWADPNELFHAEIIERNALDLSQPIRLGGNHYEDGIRYYDDPQRTQDAWVFGNARWHLGGLDDPTMGEGFGLGPWQPGTHGKGLQLKNGREFLWQTNNYDGFPTHDMFIHGHGLRWEHVKGMVELGADGSVRPANNSGWSEDWARELAAKHSQQFVDHPMFTGDWNFNGGDPARHQAAESIKVIEHDDIEPDLSTYEKRRPVLWHPTRPDEIHVGPPNVSHPDLFFHAYPDAIEDDRMQEDEDQRVMTDDRSGEDYAAGWLGYNPENMIGNHPETTEYGWYGKPAPAHVDEALRNYYGLMEPSWEDQGWHFAADSTVPVVLTRGKVPAAYIGLPHEYHADIYKRNKITDFGANDDHGLIYPTGQVEWYGGVPPKHHTQLVDQAAGQPLDHGYYEDTDEGNGWAGGWKLGAIDPWQWQQSNYDNQESVLNELLGSNRGYLSAHPWKPGQYGKAIYSPTHGRAIAWGTGEDNDGTPYHDDVAEGIDSAVASAPWGWNKSHRLVINPDGQVADLHGKFIDKKATSPQAVQAVADLIGGEATPQTGYWDFIGKTAEYDDDYNSPQWEKALLLRNGTELRWPTSGEDGGPTHAQYMVHHDISPDDVSEYREYPYQTGNRYRDWDDVDLRETYKQNMRGPWGVWDFGRSSAAPAFGVQGSGLGQSQGSTTKTAEKFIYYNGRIYTGPDSGYHRDLQEEAGIDWDEGMPKGYASGVINPDQGVELYHNPYNKELAVEGLRQNGYPNAHYVEGYDYGWKIAGQQGSYTPEGYPPHQPGKWGRYVIDNEGDEHRWSEQGPEHWRWIEDHPHLEMASYGYIHPNGARENYDIYDGSTTMDFGKLGSSVTGYAIPEIEGAIDPNDPSDKSWVRWLHDGSKLWAWKGDVHHGEVVNHLGLRNIEGLRAGELSPRQWKKNFGNEEDMWQYQNPNADWDFRSAWDEAKQDHHHFESPSVHELGISVHEAPKSADELDMPKSPQSPIDTGLPPGDLHPPTDLAPSGAELEGSDSPSRALSAFLRDIDNEQDGSPSLAGSEAQKGLGSGADHSSCTATWCDVSPAYAACPVSQSSAARLARQAAHVKKPSVPKRIPYSLKHKRGYPEIGMSAEDGLSLIGTGEPESAQDDAYWKAITLQDGTHHTWRASDAPGVSHHQWAVDNGIDPRQIHKWWGWNGDRWLNYGETNNDWRFGSGVPSKLSDQVPAPVYKYRTEYGPEEYATTTPWEPGHVGKGYVNGDGSVVHWKVNEHSEPHHWDIAENLGHSPQTCIPYIWEDGTVVVPTLADEEEHQNAKMFADAIGGKVQDGDWRFGKESHMELPGRVVDVPITGDQDFSNEPWYPLIHDPEAGITYRGGEGSYHADLVDAVPELESRYTPKDNYRTITQQAQNNGNWHGRQIGNHRIVWWDKPKANDEWHFGAQQLNVLHSDEESDTPWGEGIYDNRYRNGTRPLIYDPDTHSLGIGAIGAHHGDLIWDKFSGSDSDFTMGYLHPERGAVWWGGVPQDVHDYLKPAANGGEWHFASAPVQVIQQIRPEDIPPEAWEDSKAVPQHAIDNYRPWEPGYTGRAIWDKNTNRVWLWKDPRWGDQSRRPLDDFNEIHHYGVHWSMGLPDSEVGDSIQHFYIKPDGRLEGWRGSDTAGLAALVPQLKPEDDDWHFGAEHYPPKTAVIEINGKQYWGDPWGDELHAEIANKHNLSAEQLAQAHFGLTNNIGELRWITGNPEDTQWRMQNESDLWDKHGPDNWHFGAVDWQVREWPEYQPEGSIQIPGQPRPWIADWQNKTIHLGQPGWYHAHLIAHPEKTEPIRGAKGLVSENGLVQHYDVPGIGVNEALGRYFNQKTQGMDADDWHFGSESPALTVKNIEIPAARGRRDPERARYGPPLMYHLPSNTLYIGPSGYHHAQLADAADLNYMDHIPLWSGYSTEEGHLDGQDIHRIPRENQIAIAKAVGLEPPIEEDAWRFGAIVGPSEGWPEVPDPNEHWQALNTKSQGWHVWPDEGFEEGAGDPHAVYMHKHGIPFEEAIDFAHYTPPGKRVPGTGETSEPEGRWTSYMKKYYNAYKAIYNEIAPEYQKEKDFDNAAKPTAEEWHFGAAGRLWELIGGTTNPADTLHDDGGYYNHWPVVLDHGEHVAYIGVPGTHHVDLHEEFGLDYDHERALIYPQGEDHFYEGTNDPVLIKQLGNYIGHPVKPENNEWRFGAANNLMWNPPNTGKGFTAGGKLYTWNSSGNKPHHAEMWEHFRKADPSLPIMGAAFAIDPSGRVTKEYGDPAEFVPHLDQDPRLNYDLSPSEWKFGSAEDGEGYEWGFSQPVAKLHFPEGFDPNPQRPGRIPFVWTIPHEGDNEPHVYFGHPGGHHDDILDPGGQAYAGGETYPALHEGLYDRAIYRKPGEPGKEWIGGFGSVKPRAYDTGNEGDRENHLEFYDVPEPQTMGTVADAISDYEPFGLPPNEAVTNQVRKDRPWHEDWHFGAYDPNGPIPNAEGPYKRPMEPVALEEIQPWRKGQYGKFIGFPDGYVHAWQNQPNPYVQGDQDIDEATARDGWPSHGGVAKALGRPLDWEDESTLEGHSIGYISPKGEVDLPIPSDRAAQHIESLKRMHPEITESGEGNWSFSKAASDPYHNPEFDDDWEDEFDRQMKDKMANPPSDNEIRALVEAGVPAGEAGKGIALPDGTVLKWVPDEYGSPHHDDVMHALRLEGADAKYLHVDADGTLTDLNEVPDAWAF